MLTSHAVNKQEAERRSCRRATLQWVVLVYFGGDQWGKLIDLSERGMRFQFEHAPTLRQSINFTFEAMGCMAIPSEGKVFGDSIQATGRVMWTREFERTAGVEFIELSQRSRDQIRYWISSGALLEAAAPGQDAHPEWNKKRSKKADQKAVPRPSPALAAAPHAPTELAPPSAKPSFEPPQEVFESDLNTSPSDLEVVWEPERPPAPSPLDEPVTPRKKWPVDHKREATLAPVVPEQPASSRRKRPAEAAPEIPFAPPAPTLEEPAPHRRKWSLDPKPEPAFAPPSDLEEPAAPRRKWAREPESEHSYLPPTIDEAAAAELREKLEALSHRERPAEFEPEDSAAPTALEEPAAAPMNWPAEPELEPAPTPEEFNPVPPERQGFWESKGSLASEGVEPLGFDVPAMLHHDERQRRGQTLELKQRRTRVGFIAVLGFLGTLGALAGIIRFTSKFNAEAEAPRPSENRVASAEGGAAGEGNTFLVEVLDAANRRSVLLFSAQPRPNKSGPGAQDSSLPETSVMAVQQPREETKTKAGASHDFTLIAPRAASSQASANSSLEAPALPAQAPASLDAPLQSLPSPVMPSAADRTPPVGGDVQPARLVHAVLPAYPQIARTNRVAGDVTLDALVDETGTVRDVQVISGPLLLREAAKEALRQWRYEPARLDGQATRMHLTVTVKFQNNQGGR